MSETLDSFSNDVLKLRQGGFNSFERAKSSYDRNYAVATSYQRGNEMSKRTFLEIF